ncbi:MAG: carboxymuconolactone decarboxylase family protein [Phycicoccus sp.]
MTSDTTSTTSDADDTAWAGYRDRQLLGVLHWPDARAPFFELEKMLLGDGALPTLLKLQIHLVVSIELGCAHTQAHASFGQSSFGVDLDRIRALWDFENDDSFSAAELAAFRAAQAAASRPNATTPAHHEALRGHYDDQQVREIIGAIGWSALLNTMVDTVALVTDHGSADWARENLSVVGWSLGKHGGTDAERLGPLRAGMLERNGAPDDASTPPSADVTAG